MSAITSNGGTSAEGLNASNGLEQLYCLPFSDIDSRELSFIAGCTDAEVESLPFSDFTWNVMANAIMKKERQKRRGRKNERLDFDLFIDLPLDLILEIFGHLHPIDLYHVVHTSKTLRHIILSRNSTSLWKTSFACHPSVPKCPPGVSEPQWTTLLFGPMICDECGKHGAVLDFVFRRHLCTKCLRDYDICVSRVPMYEEQVLYEQNDVIWDLVPASDRNEGNRYWTHGNLNFEQVSQEGRYLQRELRAVAQKLEELRKDIAQDKPSAKEKFESFKQVAKTTAIQIMEHAEICTDWAAEIFDDVANDSWNRQLNVKARIEARMVAHGHNPEDVDSYELQNFLLMDGVVIDRLTRRVWRDIRPTVESIIADNKEQRRLAVREQLLATRGQVIKSAYLQYQRSLAPVTWSAMPNYEELLQYEAFSALLNDTSDTELTVAGCSDAVTKIPEYIVHWRQQKLRHLLNQLPGTEMTNPDDPTLSMHRLRLATSIFTCVDCKTKNASGICLFGWEDVSVHVRCATLVEQGLQNLVHSTMGTTIAATLISFLGLDPSTASATDMDRVDARLLCARCPIRSYRHVRGHEVYTWREYITHVLCIQGDVAHFTNAWHLLTSEVTALIRLHEDKYPHPSDKAWSCNHCSVHFYSLVSRKDAFEHIKEMHSIPAPLEGTDIIHYSGPEAQHTRRRPVGLGESPLTEFRCARCAGRGTRLYTDQRLRQHLFDTHEISSPVLGTDFVKIDIILRSSNPV